MGITVVPLYTREGEEIARVPIVPFAKPPEAILWGERFFVRREGDGKYYEAFCHYVTHMESDTVGEIDNNGHH